VTEAELEKLVIDWIDAQSSDVEPLEKRPGWWAVEQVMDWALDGSTDKVWEFIVATYKRGISEKVFAMLAAGPLEDLLAMHGAEYIDRIEVLAWQDPEFNRLIGGVWQNIMSDDIWARVQDVRNEVW
jgi:hypothetical protein